MTQKVILITGVSSGIGKACAKYLSDKGYKVYGTCRNSIEKSNLYEIITMDITSNSSIEKAIHFILSKEKGIDILINNAGMGIGGAIEDNTNEEIDLQFKTNFFGTLNVCKAVIPIMREKKQGIIINISSLGGLMGLPFQGMYSATKFAIEGLSESLRYELKNTGIKIVLINPGDFKTNFTDNRKITQKSKTGLYSEQFTKTLQVIENDERNGANPIKIAKKINNIINKKSPKMRYLIGKPGQIIFAKLKGLLPSKIFMSIIGSHYKI
ncbi:MAG: SDR family oxidoreductase [Bacteroidales bacterium]|nr:SDR family oxidoreductase [Bacteroidales bacterium]